ncbi:PDZ and LIM domain-containing protein 7 [Nannizzia gypsea CBS 118893]|uniref:PDZ and LIM domain-containing protein 7 n=1 Tax=Arthroderma gypseum (strain ATCC MYA-4604 / CBS 118893) TaxID=535722 RepID=E4V6F7_ARTGP|nr:PDZ and LIM domain-containing protein 7 [Nannizzia gypsea CBS 118893]EFQ96673.1 PDZ and LIM domain-containing protein 7 [Nannizzia gypsea CBS 118893]
MHGVKLKSSPRKVSPPGPTFMNDEELGSYLRDLRTARPPRPNGSRPLPSKVSGPAALPNLKDIPVRPASSFSTRPSETVHSRPNSKDIIPRSSSAFSHRRTTSEVSTPTSSSSGTPTIPECEVFNGGRNVSHCGSSLSSATSSTPIPYIERGQRWMERQEVRSLRSALEEMDVQDDENRLFEAAQEEATELVLQHQTHGFKEKDTHAAYRNPDLKTISRLRQHLEKGSHSRTSSLGYGGDTAVRSQSITDSIRSSSECSSGGQSASDKTSDGMVRPLRRVNFAVPKVSSEKRKEDSQSRRRSVSGGSSKGIFRNPEDSIYEEPEETGTHEEPTTAQNTAPTSALTAKPHNSVLRGARPFPNRWSGSSAGGKLNRFDIHKNPPSQTRNPLYTTNTYTPREQTPESENEQSTLTKNGIEIRDDEIRAATSMKLKDRSTKLPMPSAVSDRPGRPIVSFDPHWKETEQEEPASLSSNEPPTSSGNGTPSQSINSNNNTPAPQAIPEVSVSAPKIPSISIENEAPAAPEIRVSPLGPTISEMEQASQVQQRRELPSPGQHQSNRHSGSMGIERYQSLSKAGIPTASCVVCGLSISGRVVIASSYRLHPECFSCFHCRTPLECVAFYPEPEEKRRERLSQLDAHRGLAFDTPRFYCHLDFHELFSPRCKSCKTPIEGEVIVACGSTWHAGHFFCAECGDPFTPTTPFIEKEGFAWCVRCHSRRTASKCKACKKPVLDDVVVSALGGQWHDECFRCDECKGSFGPDGRFFVRQGKPKVNARGRQIGGPVELPVCEACESRRLKA